MWRAWLAALDTAPGESGVTDARALEMLLVKVKNKLIDSFQNTVLNFEAEAAAVNALVLNLGFLSL